MQASAHQHCPGGRHPGRTRAAVAQQDLLIPSANDSIMQLIFHSAACLLQHLPANHRLAGSRRRWQSRCARVHPSLNLAVAYRKHLSSSNRVRRDVINDLFNGTSGHKLQTLSHRRDASVTPCSCTRCTVRPRAVTLIYLPVHHKTCSASHTPQQHSPVLTHSSVRQMLLLLRDSSVTSGQPGANGSALQPDFPSSCR